MISFSGGTLQVLCDGCGRAFKDGGYSFMYATEPDGGRVERNCTLDLCGECMRKVNAALDTALPNHVEKCSV